MSDIQTAGPQPMATAPRDGTRVLLCYPEQENDEPIAVGSWAEWVDGQPLWCIDGGEGWSDTCVTAWWPLPRVVSR